MTYRVYAESQRSLRRLLAGDARQREYRGVEAVSDVSFVAYAGQSVGVIGHNGSGKSTLLRAIGGLMPATSGEVWVKSTPVLLGVKAALESELSARQNIFLGGAALRIPRREVRDRFDEIVEFAGVQDFIDLPLRAFSSGMRARLQFAIATSAKPEILMVDEALAVGDAEFKERADQRIRELIAGSTTLFFVSHSMRAVRDICTRVLWIDHGRLVADGPSEQVIAAYSDHAAGRG